MSLPPAGSPWPPDSPKPTGPSAGWAVLLWVVATLCLGGAVFSGWAAYASYSFAHELDSGVRATATVTEIDPAQDSVTVEFTTADGSPSRAELSWSFPDYPAVGEELDITYDDRDPTVATTGGRDEMYTMAKLFGFFAAFPASVAVGSTVGATLVHQARRRTGPSRR